MSLAGDAADSLPARLDRYGKYFIVCTCAASLTWVLKGGVAARLGTVETKTGTAVVFAGDGGWPAGELAWSGNGGADDVYIDVQTSAALARGHNP